MNDYWRLPSNQARQREAWRSAARKVAAVRWDYYPHWFVRRPSVVRPFNLDAPRPCRCGADARDAIHDPSSVAAFLATVAEPVLEVERESITSLHGRREWVGRRLATPAEIELAAAHEQFWLDSSDVAYYALVARRVSDRLARVRMPA